MTQSAPSIEVFHHRITAVVEAMGATLQRAAYSPNIKERRDFSCAAFDGRGRLIAQAAHIPVHLGAMPAAVSAAQDHVGQWQPGDVVALNDPFQGGSHLPDITMVSPVMVAGASQPLALVVTRAHHADVGGTTPGSLPLARDLFAEGLIVPPIRLVHSGQLMDDLVAMLCANSRTPEERRGDLAAQLAAHRTGERRLGDLIGADPITFQDSVDALLSYSERLARSRLADLREGEYQFQDFLDNDGVSEAAILISVRITISNHQLVVDFTGTAPQTTTGVNAPLAVTLSAVYYVVACLVGDIPINAGMFAPVAVITPPGTIVNPNHPAAVAAGNVETSQRLVDVLLGALAGAAPDRIPAASQGTMNNVIIGGTDPRHGQQFTYYETLGGGSGGAPGAAGASGIQVHMTNTRNTPAEALETAYPVRVEAYRLRRGSRGTGRFPGGNGLERHLRCLTYARATVLSERRAFAPWGLAGGGRGLRGENVLVTRAGETPLPGKVTFDVAPGDVVIVRTPGGGGWGESSAPATDECDRGPPG